MKEVCYWTASACGEVSNQTLVRSLCKLNGFMLTQQFSEKIQTLQMIEFDENASGSPNTEQFLDMFEKLPGKSIDDDMTLNSMFYK